MAGKSMNNDNSDKKPKNTTIRNFLKKVFLIKLITFYFFLAVGIGTASGIVVAFSRATPEFNPNEIKSGLPSTIKDREGDKIITLDREQRREEVSIDEIPLNVKNAFIAIEDSRFYDHSGVDLRGILRAARNNLSETGNPFRGSQGGSTITQQLVKNAFLSPDPVLERKIQEARLALQLENYYSKDEILELYLNHATYFNHNNYGVQAASEFYFDKHVSDLNIEEAALLAGIIRMPSRLSPHENSDQARSRQLTVLRAMYAQGYITQNEYNNAVDKELEELLTPIPKREVSFPYFVNYVIHKEAIEIMENEIIANIEEFETIPESAQEPEDILYHHGLTIYTTMDRELQSYAENIINDPDNYPETWEDESGIKQPQGALVVSDPSTGEVQALVGGRDYNYDNMYNRVNSTRSPGSAMKPINVYAPAIEEGLITPSSVIDDSPTAWEIYGDYYTPENFDRSFTGLTTVRDSLVRSLNVPAVKVYKDKLGTKTGSDYAGEFGISTLTDSDKDNAAAAIGGLKRGVKPFELTEAYATLANEGKRVKHHTITKIEDREGNVIYEKDSKPTKVVSNETAWLVNDMLQDVISEGTAASLNLNFPAAAKTGTSHNYRDAWLVGYTPELVTSFWLGYDQDNIRVENRTNYTTRVIQKMMDYAMSDTKTREFQKPGSIEGPISISTKSGLLPSQFTPASYISEDYFPSGKVPETRCNALVQVEVCTAHDSVVRASQVCPNETTETRTFLNRERPKVTDERWGGGAGRTARDSSMMPPRDICSLSLEEHGIVEEDEQDDVEDIEDIEETDDVEDTEETEDIDDSTEDLEEEETDQGDNTDEVIEQSG